MRLFTSFLLLSVILLSSCMKSKKVDLIVHNAIIHSLDDHDTEYEAMAIKDGKIVELGPERQILNKYRAEKTVDARSRHIYPGLTDAHAHLKLAAKSRIGLDLRGMKSFEQILFKLEQFHAKHPTEPIIARGWSESDWSNQTTPTNEQLNKLFPTIPVCLFRVDEHTALVNNYLLDKAMIDASTNIEGGQIIIKDEQPTGILTDQALERVKPFIPQPSEQDLLDALMNLQEELFMYGITTVHDAGFEDGDYSFFQKFVEQQKWHLKTYGMLLPTEKNFALAKKGILKNDNLSARTFKFFIDGSLGSHGALLKAPYSDDMSKGHGTLNIAHKELEAQVKRCADLGYQVAFHAIGDSAVRIALELTLKHNEDHPDHRWRLEHGIFINPTDYNLLLNSGIIPSLQPLQAISDAPFLQDRFGDLRLKATNAFQTVLNQTGIILLGSDFPVESHNIHRTIQAAANPTNKNEALTMGTIVKSLTIWPAIAVFDEKNSGSLETGKEATFAVFTRSLNQGDVFRENFSMSTYIKGKEVYSAE